MHNKDYLAGYNRKTQTRKEILYKIYSNIVQGNYFKHKKIKLK